MLHSGLNKSVIFSPRTSRSELPPAFLMEDDSNLELDIVLHSVLNKSVIFSPRTSTSELSPAFLMEDHSDLELDIVLHSRIV